MFKCLGWLCPATFIFFLLFETPIVTLWSPCALKHVMWQRVFLGASEFKVRNLIQWTGHFAIYVRWPVADLTHHRYTVLTSSNKSETAAHYCDPTLSVLVMLVPRNVFHVVLALQSIVFMSSPFLLWPSLSNILPWVLLLKSLRLLTRPVQTWSGRLNQTLPLSRLRVESWVLHSLLLPA